MSTKIYVCLTGKVPSVFFSTIAKPVKITGIFSGTDIQISSLSNLFELTTRDTYSNLLANEEFKNALKFNYIKAYDEFAIELDMQEGKFIDPPAVPPTSGSFIKHEYLLTINDDPQLVYTFTHNENSLPFLANIYHYTQVGYGDGVVDHYTQALAKFKHNDSDPPNKIDLVFDAIPFNYVFKIIIFIFKE